MKAAVISGVGAVAFAAAVSASAGEPAPLGVQIDSAAAKRTVDALADPALTRTQALAIADLPANQALVEQARQFGTDDTRETFADALLAEAEGHGRWSIFNFAEVREHAADVRAALGDIEADPAALAGWVRDRIAPFAPQGMPPHGMGYLEAGGPGGGFSIDGRVYVNLARSKGEMGVVRLTLAHEIYHGMQHEAQAAAGTQADFEYDAKAYAKLSNALARGCYVTRQLFGSVMDEGTATYVGDTALLPTQGAEALSVRKQRAASLSGQIDEPITLLDMGVAAITSDTPVSERKIYAIGFQQAGQLYYDVAYVMAKAIAANDGDGALGRLISQPGDAFVRRYITLSDKPGSKLPRLGPNTERWALRAGC